MNREIPETLGYLLWYDAVQTFFCSGDYMFTRLLSDGILLEKTEGLIA